MRIVIEYQGKTYEGECSPLEKPDKYANELYEHLEEMTKLRMRLAGGGVLLLGNIALQSAAIKILP
jgi:hypothetical protein